MKRRERRGRCRWHRRYRTKTKRERKEEREEEEHNGRGMRGPAVRWWLTSLHWEEGHLYLSISLHISPCIWISIPRDQYLSTRLHVNVYLYMDEARCSPEHEPFYRYSYTLIIHTYIDIDMSIKIHIYVWYGRQFQSWDRYQYQLHVYRNRYIYGYIYRYICLSIGKVNHILWNGAT